MLQEASQNLSMTLDWGDSARQSQGRNNALAEGYSEDDIKNGFRIDIGFPKAAFGDRVKMLLAAAFSVFIPVLFLLALVVLLVFSVQATASAFWNQSPALPFVLFGDLLFACLIMAFVRCLTKKRGDKIHFEINDDAQPELHAFINHIATLLHGPAPTSVKLDAEVGLILRPASLKDAIGGTGPEVIIGLPLLYGLSARQLAGVIAHAYAGYSREARLYGYPILCTIDRWLFAQTAAGRSREWARNKFRYSSTAWIDVVLAPFDVIVQGLFYTIYRIVSAMTFEVSRKVDMAGDVYSARIAGSTEFRSTQFRLRSLHYGQQHAIQELVNSWKSRRLSDNFPALVVDHADTLQLSLRPRLIQEMEELVTPLTRSRIVDLGRIVHVEHTQEEGACYLLGSAISLLRDLAAVSRKVTLSQYKYLGINHPDEYATQKTQSIQKAEREKARLHEVFCGLERSSRVVRIDDFGILSEIPIAERCAEYQNILKRLRAEESNIGHLAQAIQGYEFRKNLMHTRKVVETCKGAPDSVTRELEVQWLALIKDQSDFKIQLNAIEHQFARRSALALSLALDSEAVQDILQMSRRELSGHFARLTEALNYLNRCFESIQRLRSYTQVLGQLLVESDDDSKPFAQVAAMSTRYQKYLLIELDALMKVFGSVTYPLGGISYLSGGMQHEDVDSLTVADVIVNDVADIDSASTCAEACHRVANAVCQYIDNLNEQLQQRVASVLVGVEQAYQMEAEVSPVSPK